jgi:WD40 repeat protein
MFYCIFIVILLVGCKTASQPKPTAAISNSTQPALHATKVPFTSENVDRPNSLADSQDVLTSDNVQRLVPVARVGEGIFGDHVVVSPSGDDLAVATAGGVLLMDAANGHRKTFFASPSKVESLAFSPNGQMLAVIHREPGSEVIGSDELAGKQVSNPILTMYDLVTGKAYYSLNLAGHGCGQYAAWDLSFAPDGNSLVIRDFYSQLGHARTDNLCLFSASDGAFLRSIAIELPWQSISPVLITSDSKQLVLTVVDTNSEDSSMPITRVNFYDLTTGLLVREINGQGLAHDLALSMDGATLALADQSGARLLSVQDGSLLGHFGEHDREVFSVAFSPDGATLALGSLDGTVSAWSVKDHLPLWQTVPWMPYSPWNMEDMAGEIWDLVYSPDGATLFALVPTHFMDSSGQIQALQAMSGQKNYQVNGFNTYSGPELSPNGMQVAFGGYDDGQVQVWSVKGNQPVLYLIGHTELVTGVTFSPDGKKIASASLDSTIRIWNAVDGLTVHALTGHTGPVRAIQFSPDGSQLASVGDDAALYIWNVENGQLQKSYETQSTNWLANAIVYSQDGQKILLAYGCPFINACQANGAGDLRQIDLNTGQIETRIPYSVYSITLSNDQTKFAIESAQTIQSGDATGGQFSMHKTYTSPLGNGGLSGAAISPDGQLFFAGNTFGLHVWNVVSGEMIALCKGIELPYGEMKITPDQKLVIIASPDGLINLWGIPTNH